VDGSGLAQSDDGGPAKVQAAIESPESGLDCDDLTEAKARLVPWLTCGANSATAANSLGNLQLKQIKIQAKSS
jgi:hypothetical protein